MATWDITPSNGVTNYNNGIFDLPRNDGSTDLEYIITYTDNDGCTSQVKYKIPSNCEEEYQTESFGNVQINFVNQNANYRIGKLYVWGQYVDKNGNMVKVKIKDENGKFVDLTSSFLLYLNDSYKSTCSAGYDGVQAPVSDGIIWINCICDPKVIFSTYSTTISKYRLALLDKEGYTSIENVYLKLVFDAYQLYGRDVNTHCYTDANISEISTNFNALNSYSFISKIPLKEFVSTTAFQLLFPG